MKSHHPYRSPSLSTTDFAPQKIRLIKANQAGKLLRNHGGISHDRGINHNPEIRMVGTGSDFCDLEVTCGCGEALQIRCWNAPASEEQRTK